MSIRSNGNLTEKITARFWVASLLVATAGVLTLDSTPAKAPISGSHPNFGDPRAGMQILIQKGCARCHPLFAAGRSGAPNLARAFPSYGDAAELLAGMWNHAPEMWKEMSERRIPLPMFTESEMTSLFAFLYSIRSLDEPGDSQRGQKLFAEKGCTGCHAIGRRGRSRLGPDLTSQKKRINLISWVRAIWNHAPAMQAQMETSGFRWPDLEADDVTDIISYLQGSDKRMLRLLPLRPANAEAGRQLFQKKGCASCHLAPGAGLADAPTFVPFPLAPTLPHFVARMWNHIPAMLEKMKERGVRHVEFSDQEMADLIAHLFVEQFFEIRGNSTNGRELFRKKGCTPCHVVEGESTRPGLPIRRGPVRPARFATVLWNHGPAMFNLLGGRVDFWPHLSPREMADLMAYLESVGSPRRLIDSRR